MPMNAVTPADLKRWIDANEAVVIDVREPAEYRAAHLKGSTLLPLGEVNAAKLPSLAGRKLVIHCRKGGRGGTACEKLLRELPSTDIYNLQGGLEAWEAAGLPVEESGKTVLPLDRQVQVIVGALILTGCLLGYVINPHFFLIPTFLGGGLVFAGITGFCGLARVLPFMPWNK